MVSAHHAEIRQRIGGVDESALRRWQSAARFAPVAQTSTCSAIFAAIPSAPRRHALSAIDLLANNRDGPLIDRSSIPCVDSCKIGFAGLVSCARAPAMALEEICRRGQRAGRGVETSAGAVS